MAIAVALPAMAYATWPQFKRFRSSGTCVSKAHKATTQAGVQGAQHARPLQSQPGGCTMYLLAVALPACLNNGSDTARYHYITIRLTDCAGDKALPLRGSGGAGGDREPAARGWVTKCASGTLSTQPRAAALAMIHTTTLTAKGTRARKADTSLPTCIQY